MNQRHQTPQTQETADQTLREYCLARLAKRRETGQAQPPLFSDAAPEVHEALRVLDARRFRALERWWGLLTDLVEDELRERRAREKKERAERAAAAEAKRTQRKAAKEAKLAVKRARQAAREAKRAARSAA